MYTVCAICAVFVMLCFINKLNNNDKIYRPVQCLQSSQGSVELIMSLREGEEFVVLTSKINGLIEWGSFLGQYNLIGTHNDCPCYKQSDTISSDAVYLYRDLESAWRVSRKLGDLSEEDSLYNPNDDKLNSVPLKGWWFKHGDKWNNECRLQITSGPLATVTSIDLDFSTLKQNYVHTYILTDQVLEPNRSILE